ncbi:MAG TPA: RsmB/NOP family class I SAM-dependent RNA methyltransferase [Bacteroidia bacterium]|nr:RsmB/NOP family class I SAM-dependent RNA methyltransferase [Bacteroidia bacterium]
MKERNQLQHIVEVISNYNCDSPLSVFLKNYFQQHRNMGSNDRRMMRSFVYNYFRLRNSLKNLSMEEQIAIGSFLVLKNNIPLLDYCIRNFSTVLPEHISFSTDEKIKIISQAYPEFNLNNIFPFQHYLSNEISADDFYKSFLVQPDAWLRVRKNFKENVLKELSKNNIAFKGYQGMPLALSIDNSVALNNLKSFEKGYFEIQDVSSQKNGIFFQPNENEHWWDCCAGSGGKSLLLSEQAENLKITASDNRDSILENLRKRFSKANIKNFAIKKTDLLTAGRQLPDANCYDGIIADVPCSGSGTWSRTPEMLTCFDESELEEYSNTQKEILKNISPYLKKGKPLIYITCSVFKNENENIVEFAVNALGFQLNKMELIKGYDKKADTLFVARLIKK